MSLPACLRFIYVSSTTEYTVATDCTTSFASFYMYPGVHCLLIASCTLQQKLDSELLAA